MSSHGFGVGVRLWRGWAVERELEDFGQVERAARRALGDLFAATETVGDDEPIGWRLADGRQEFEFADSH